MKRFVAECLLIIICMIVSIHVFTTKDITYASQVVTYDSFASIAALKCSQFMIAVIEFFFQMFYILITQWIG